MTENDVGMIMSNPKNSFTYSNQIPYSPDNILYASSIYVDKISARESNASNNIAIGSKLNGKNLWDDFTGGGLGGAQGFQGSNGSAGSQGCYK